MTAVEDLAAELVLLFRSLKALHRAVLSEAGVRLEMPATAVLATLSEGQRRASTLAEMLHVDLSTISRQVAALEREGWVQRERDPADSRAALLDLTDTGRAVLAQVHDTRLAHLDRRLPGWTADELQDFTAQLRRFRADLGTDASCLPRQDAAAPDATTSPTNAPTPALSAAKEN